MWAWLIGSIHSPARPARNSQSAFFGCTWMTPCTVPIVSPAAPVAKNFQRWRVRERARTSRAWNTVRKTLAAKHQ